MAKAGGKPARSCSWTGSLGTGAHWPTRLPRAPCRTSLGSVGRRGQEGGGISEELQRVPSLGEGLTGATGTQDANPEGSTEDSSHTFQPPSA